MGDFTEFEKYIITRLDTLDDKISEVSDKVSGIRAKVAVVSTVVSAAWGVVIAYFTKKFDA